MTHCRPIFTTLLFLLAIVASGQTSGAQKTVVNGQRFYYLTADEVRIDTLLPSVSQAMPLPLDYADSVYTAEIFYPEFVAMGADDSRHYDALTQAPLPVLPVVEQCVVTTRRRPSLLFTIQPLAERDGKRLFLASFMLRITATPKAAAQSPADSTMTGSAGLRPASSAAQGNTSAAKGNISPRVRRVSGERAQRYAPHSRLATGRWAKIRVPATGLYELTAATVRRAGFNDLSRVHIFGYGGNLIPETLSPEYLAATDDLPEVLTANVNGRRLFHARGPVSFSPTGTAPRTRNPYSAYGYYLITEGDTPADTISADALLQQWRDDPTPHYTLHETDNFYWYQGGRNLVEATATEAGKHRDIKIAAPALADTLSACRMTIAVSAGVASTFSVALNDSTLGSGSMRIADYDHGAFTTLSFRLPAIRRENTVRLTCNTGGPLRLDYVQLYAADLVSQPDLATATIPAAEYVHNITTQDHHADTPVALTVIIPTSQRLLPQAQRLAAHHAQRDGMTTRIVPADELYNEFASGTPDVSAYRRYMKMLYDRAPQDTAVMHLLLMGDCVFDNRLLTSDCRSLSADDLLLCYESDNSTNAVRCHVSDDFLAMLDDNEAIATGDIFTGTPDIAVGRLPVRTPEEAESVVTKTIAYAENRNAGPWQNTIVCMGDDGNNNLHMADIDDLADDVQSRYPGYHVRKVMWDAYRREVTSTGNRYPDVTALLKAQQQAGALVMDYCGHGSSYTLSHEMVLTLSDFQQFTNQNLPLWITASCDTAPFDGLEETIGETLLLNKQGGGVAFFGTARTVYSNYNRHINEAFMRAALGTTHGRRVTLGEANRWAKEQLVLTGHDRTCNKLQYALLGDPALSLCTPQLRCIVDSINGVATDATTLPTLHANSHARIVGHIASSDGTRSEAFTGLVSALVRDTRQEKTCLNNIGNTDEGAEEPFTFFDRTNTLFTGTDSVRQGRFALSFAMPRDINYADARGLITLFAHSDDATAHGETDAFLVGGTAEVYNDSIGPSIYCYLNSPSFTNGGTVNATPFFVAELRDNDGLNTSTGGIGHDMRLTVDNDPQLSFSLSDNFQYDFGSFTSGSTYYALPELSAGSHTLEFRAWDVLNNPATARLTFRVINGLAPGVAEVNVTRNPARDATTFIIAHDRPGTPVTAEIEVFDAAGRLLTRLAQTTTATQSTTALPWDLTTADGHRLPPGVYLYRATIAADNARRASKAKKLVIIK